MSWGSNALKAELVAIWLRFPAASEGWPFDAETASSRDAERPCPAHYRLYDQLDHDALEPDAPEGFPGDLQCCATRTTDLIENPSRGYQPDQFRAVRSCVRFRWRQRQVLDGALKIAIRDDDAQAYLWKVACPSPLTRTTLRPPATTANSGSAGMSPNDGAEDDGSYTDNLNNDNSGLRGSLMDR